MSNLSLLPNIKDNSHIGILGGSFDPPHICHQLLALSFLALEPIDELWIIPCGDHAFKQPTTDFLHRFTMCQIAFERIRQVRVLDIENRLPSPSYTIETINYILQSLPSINIHLGIGSDLVNSFHKWQNAIDIANKTRINVFERKSYPVQQLPPILAHAHVHRGYELPDINSTSLRKFLRRDTKHESLPYVDREVVSYIKRNNLYVNAAHE